MKRKCNKCNEDKEQKEMYSKNVCKKCNRRADYIRKFGTKEERIKFNEVRKALRQV